MRTSTSLFAFFGFLIFAAAAPVLAQNVPAVPACAIPNQSARMTTAAIPALPAYAAQIQAHGTVVVLVDLDQNAKIIAMRVATSQSPVLNTAALDAVRASTFVAEVHDCIPRPSLVPVTVAFPDAGSPPLTVPPTMLAYFSGAWSCATKLGSSTVRLFGVNIPRTSLLAANAFTDANGALYQSLESYTLQGDTISVLQRVGFVFSGTSKGWTGDTLTFEGVETSGPTARAQAMTYRRTDATHFVRTFASVPADGPPIVTSTEQCVRIPAPEFRR